MGDGSVQGNMEVSGPGRANKDTVILLEVVSGRWLRA